jgi:hypothetical protein
MVKYRHILPIILLSVFSVFPFSVAQSADWYVATNGAGAGTNGWADATNSLQGAIAGCASGSTVWVSNGVYVVNLTVGAGVTARSIDNNPASVILDGNAAGRVVSNTANSWLIGCTITNGLLSLSEGAGVWKGMVSNCVIVANKIIGNIYGGGGGGVSECAVFNSSIVGNIISNVSGAGSDGSGSYNSAVRDSVISNNIAFGPDVNGAGAGMSSLLRCTIRNNSSMGGKGGGLVFGNATNCSFVSNYANANGGGSFGSVLYNCLLVNNTTDGGGGASREDDLFNCSVYSNSATGSGGGVYGSDLLNTISFENNKSDFIMEGISGSEAYSCGIGYTGTGSITNNPLFVSSSDFRLQSTSPCINTGTNGAWTFSTIDLDGNLRIWPSNGQADMGAYEYGSQPSYPPAGTVIIFRTRSLSKVVSSNFNNIRGKIQ